MGILIAGIAVNTAVAQPSMLLHSEGSISVIPDYNGPNNDKEQLKKNDKCKDKIHKCKGSKTKSNKKPLRG